jgi:hypothetical protein
MFWGRGTYLQALLTLVHNPDGRYAAMTQRLCSLMIKPLAPAQTCLAAHQNLLSWNKMS